MRSVNRLAAMITVAAAAASLGACSSNGSKTGGASNDVDGSGGAAGATSAMDGGVAAGFPKDALSTFRTPDNTLSVELRTSPEQPIHVGPDNEAQLRITNVSSGEPVDGLTLKVTTWMPVMRHKCSQVPVGVKAMGNGEYILTPLVASMTGKCELQISLSLPLPDGGTSASVELTSPTFDVGQ